MPPAAVAGAPILQPLLTGSTQSTPQLGALLHGAAHVFAAGLMRGWPHLLKHSRLKSLRFLEPALEPTTRPGIAHRC